VQKDTADSEKKEKEKKVEYYKSILAKVEKKGQERQKEGQEKR